MEAVSLSTCAYCGSPTNQEIYCCLGCETLSQGFGRLSVSSEELQHLDQSNFKKLYRNTTAEYDYQLYVEGIHCSSCIHIIEKLPIYYSRISAARVDFSQSKLFLKVSDDFSLSQALQILSSMGYRAHFLKPSEQIDISLQNENKALLKKLAVAGACAGNIMLFVIPIYSGVEDFWKVIFNWVGFVLFLPIVFYSGTTFYKSAWAGLRLRIVNIDLPITLALLSGFVLSTINLIRGNGAIYYDSTASFIFLILSSRYFLRRIQQKINLPYQIETDFMNQKFARLSDSNVAFVSPDDLQKNDLIKLNAGQIIPIDGTIVADQAMIDVSVLNGEPLPRKFAKGMQIQAGSRAISDKILIQVTTVAKETHLVKILNQLRSGMWRKSKFVTLTDKCAQILILSVFVIALATFIALFNVDPQEAFNRALALIVLACPCALALGSPLAVAFAVKKLQEKGIFIKNTDSLEKVLKLENIFLDKTGTLTHTDLNLISTVPSVLPDNIKAILVSLEQKSYHPIAFAIRNLFSEIQVILVTDLKEIPGYGVQGIIDSHFYQLVHVQTDSDSNSISVVLKKDGQFVCTLSFENSLRREAKETVKSLQDKGLSCFILSGDSQSRVNDAADICGIPREQAHGYLSSEQKCNFIQKKKNTCMIGDGTNDALALQSADVGIAVKGSTSINLEAADIFFARSGLGSLLDLFELAQKAKRVLVRNLAFSLIYNIIGGALAILGFINPLTAAILMPISSFIILLSTVWGLR